KAFRKICRAQENLYTIRGVSIHLNHFFLEPPVYNQLDNLDSKADQEVQTGLIHEGIEDNYYARGAMSMYIPESYDGITPLPMVVALHGGFGHGRDFIWAWLREARSRKYLLLSPTSLDTTWSLLNPKLDGTTLYKMLDQVRSNWNVDPNRILLTGISDGGTFALVCSLQKDSPFTAFAPIASTLPPMDISNAKDKRILWTHGALDWMFPVDIAKGAYEKLKMAEADITLRVVDDLSHTYPRDENDRILKWFDPELALPDHNTVNL
ncbi:MAG: phospholipase, partial [Deltaproteobacteria bacterium]|nr:phospholipase [Deltaproteobacteria bacterium]